MSEEAVRSNKSSEKRSFKTIAIWLPDEAAMAARAIARHGRDIQNTALFLLRSGFESYKWDPIRKKSTLKPKELRPIGSAETIKAFNASILKINQEREARAGLGCKAAKALEPLGETVASLAGTLLDQTLLERVLKERPDLLAQDKKTTFSRLPFKLSRGFSEAARVSVSTWLKSIKAGTQGDGGRANVPGYQAKGTLPPIEIAEAQCRLPRIAALDLFVDEAKVLLATEEQKAAWDELNVSALLERALKGRWGEASQRPQHWEDSPKLKEIKSLRILIEGKRAKLQAIVEIPSVLPSESFYAELARRKWQDWEKLWGGKRKSFDEWMGVLVSSQTWQKGPKATSDPTDWIGERFSVCGVDLGVSNIAAVGFSDGSKGAIFSGKMIDRRLEEIDLKIDKEVSRLACQELRELQAKWSAAQLANECFPRADTLRRRELSRAVHQCEGIRLLRAQRASVVRDVAHQTAHSIAALAVKRKAAFVVAGRNLGWKTESNLGKKQNRRFHRIPHGLILVLLREKLDERGIALIETEESWTSRASFADHESLERPAAAAKKVKAKIVESLAPKAWGRDSDLKVECEVRSKIREEIEIFENRRAEPAHSACRGEGKERHWLFRQGPWPRAASCRESGRPKVHADLNGALNVIKKVCPRFKWSERVSLKHEVWGFQGGRGFAPLIPSSRILPKRV